MSTEKGTASEKNSGMNALGIEIQEKYDRYEKCCWDLIESGPDSEKEALRDALFSEITEGLAVYIKNTMKKQLSNWGENKIGLSNEELTDDIVNEGIKKCLDAIRISDTGESKYDASKAKLVTYCCRAAIWAMKDMLKKTARENIIYWADYVTERSGGSEDAEEDNYMEDKNALSGEDAVLQLEYLEVARKVIAYMLNIYITDTANILSKLSKIYAVFMYNIAVATDENRVREILGDSFSIKELTSVKWTYLEMTSIDEYSGVERTVKDNADIAMITLRNFMEDDDLDWDDTFFSESEEMIEVDNYKGALGEASFSKVATQKQVANWVKQIREKKTFAITRRQAFLAVGAVID